MTRAEKLAQQEHHMQAQVTRARQRYIAVQRRRKQAEQQARTRRYVAVGAMAEKAGLLTLESSDLAGLFALVGRLVQVPHPVPVLEALLHDVSSTCGASAEACLPQCGDVGVGVRGTAAPASGGVTALQ